MKKHHEGEAEDPFSDCNSELEILDATSHGHGAEKLVANKFWDYLLDLFCLKLKEGWLDEMGNKLVQEVQKIATERRPQNKSCNIGGLTQTEGQDVQLS